MVLNKPFSYPHAVIFLHVTDVILGIGHHRIINVYHWDLFTVGTFQRRFQVDIGLRRNQQALKSLGDHGFRNRQLTHLIVFVGCRLISHGKTVFLRTVLITLTQRAPVFIGQRFRDAANHQIAFNLRHRTVFAVELGPVGTIGFGVRLQRGKFSRIDGGAKQ